MVHPLSQAPPHGPVRARGATPLPDRSSAGQRASWQALQALLQRLARALRQRFADRDTASRHRRGLAQRRALLGLELLCKIEEHVLQPALWEARPAQHAALDQLQRELALMRELSALAGRTVAANRDVVVAVIEGLSDLHFERLQLLLREAGPEALPWPALTREVRGLLGRWRAEVLVEGDIEDEDRDPVGLPPR